MKWAPRKEMDFCRNRILENDYCTCRIHTGNGVVEQAIPTFKNNNGRHSEVNQERKSSVTSNVIHR